MHLAGVFSVLDIGLNFYGLEMRRSIDGDGGWSLHPPDTRDDEIASGEVPPILSGPGHYDPHVDKWDGPIQLDYDWAGLHYQDLKESVEDSLRRWQIQCLAAPTDRHLLTPRDIAKIELLRPRLERMADPLKKAPSPLYTHPGIFEELIATLFECAGYGVNGINLTLGLISTHTADSLLRGRSQSSARDLRMRSACRQSGSWPAF
jgi:hypothetical protein